MDIKEIIQRIRWKEQVSELTKKRTIGRIRTLTDAIERQFPEVQRSNQIKLKHMLFLKNAWFCNEGLAPATIGDHIRAMRLIIKAIDKDPQWLGPLKLVQNRQQGGRPTVSRVTRSKSRNVRR